jgi:hypothetical protein
VFSFTSGHDIGTLAVLRQHEDGWRISIHIREAKHNPLTISGYFAATLEKAKQLAGSEILKHGHVCSAACKGWF